MLASRAAAAAAALELIALERRRLVGSMYIRPVELAVKMTKIRTGRINIHHVYDSHLATNRYFTRKKRYNMTKKKTIQTKKTN